MAATAMIFSCGCQAVCRIFLLKSKQSTPISSFLRLPPVQTLRGFNTVLGFMFSRDASSVTSRLDSLSNILKKLLYEPVIMCLKQENSLMVTFSNSNARGILSTTTFFLLFVN